MSSSFGTKKNFLERLQAQKDENKAQAGREAEFAEASFKSIIDKAKSLADDVNSLGDPHIKVSTVGPRPENSETYYATITFKRGLVDHPITIRLNQSPNSKLEFIVSGLTADAIGALTAPRHKIGESNVAVDVNQSFEIAQALEDFAVRYFAQIR